jgi:hypothetical protein
LILAQHRRAVRVRIRVICRSTSNTAAAQIVTRLRNKIVIRNDDHPDSEIALINSIHTIHDEDFGGERSGNSVRTDSHRVFIRSRKR